MILFANGCSFTAGGGLEPILTPNRAAHNLYTENYIKQYTWPKHLGNLLKHDVVNYGERCGSNDRILRTTFEWLSDLFGNKKKFYTKKIDPDNIAVVIQWTEPSRFECYDGYANDHSWKKIKLGINTLHKDEIPFTDRFLSVYTSTLQDGYKFLMSNLCMIEILRSFGIKKYLFWTEENFYRLKEYPNTIQQRLHTIPIVYMSPTNHEIEYLSCAHPSLKGHQQIAEILHTNFSKLYK